MTAAAVVLWTYVFLHPNDATGRTVDNLSEAQCKWLSAQIDQDMRRYREVPIGICVPKQGGAK
jgi:hypothetical protein